MEYHEKTTVVSGPSTGLLGKPKHTGKHGVTGNVKSAGGHLGDAVAHVGHAVGNVGHAASNAVTGVTDKAAGHGTTHAICKISKINYLC